MTTFKNALTWGAAPLAMVFALLGCGKKDEDHPSAPIVTDAPATEPAESQTYNDYTMTVAQNNAKEIWLKRGYKTLYLLDAVERYDNGNHRIIVTTEMESDTGRRYIGQIACTNDKNGCRPMEASLMFEPYWTRNREPDFTLITEEPAVIEDQEITSTPGGTPTP